MGRSSKNSTSWTKCGQKSPRIGHQIKIPPPPTIQIQSRERTAIVADHHAVRIQHRDKFEDEPVPQLFCFFMVGYQEIDHSLHHPAGRRLAGMHARGHDHSEPVFQLRLGRCKVCDRYQIAGVARKGLAQFAPSKDVCASCRFLDRLQIPLEVGVRVRVALGYVHDVVIMRKIQQKGQRVVRPPPLRNSVLIVRGVRPRTLLGGEMTIRSMMRRGFIVMICSVPLPSVRFSNPPPHIVYIDFWCRFCLRCGKTESLP